MKPRFERRVLNFGVGRTLLAGLPQLCGGITAESSLQRVVAQLLSKQASR